jgi:uncharacterized protein (DUF2141 family)
MNRKDFNGFAKRWRADFMGAVFALGRATRRSAGGAPLSLVIALGSSATFLAARHAAATAKTGTLTLRISGFDHDKGPVIAKLFRRGDNAPRGKEFRKAVGTVKSRRAVLAFSDVPWDTYAVFVFHDENGNGTVDHNFLGIPIEPLGFSANFKPTIWTGIPTFDDLKFEFNPKTKPLSIVVD